MDAWDSFLARYADMIGGPGKLRFIVQPLIAIVFGLRAGRHDAETGMTPYFMRLLFGEERSRAVLVEGLREILMPLSLAIVMDAILSAALFHRVYPVSSVVIGVVLVVLPYMAVRGLSNRLFRSHRRVRGAAQFAGTSA